MRSMSTAAVGAARRARHDRDQVRLRPGAVRRLHRACRRRGDALFTRRPHHYGKPRTELIMRSLLLLSITAIAAGLVIANCHFATAAVAGPGGNAFGMRLVRLSSSRSN